MLGCVPYPNLPGCSFSMPSNTLFFLSAFMILLSLTTQRKAYRISTDKPGRSFDSVGQDRHAMSTEQEPTEQIP